MSVSTAPATLPLRMPRETVVAALGVAGFLTLLTWAAPASAESILTIRLVQLALAASAAYLVDDAAAALTKVAPRSLWQHRAFPLVVGLAAIAVSWSVVLMNLRHLPGATLRSITIEVAVLMLVALTASAVLAMRGEPEPGNQVAVVVPLAGVGALVLGGVLGFDVFIGEPGGGYTEHVAAWVIGGVLALAVLAWASRDKPA
jgi:hypothetical protein